MSHYLTRYCDEHGMYEADVDGDQECEECRAQGKLQYQIDKHRIAALESEVAALRAELAQHKASLPTCEKHKPDRGARSGCVVCSGHTLSYALSRIDYACGEPNEMECSDYDVHYNEDEVVKRVVALRAEVEGMREDAELTQAVKYACEHLPEWCEVTLFMERGAGWISWSDEHGNEYDVEPNDDSLAKQIIRSVAAARKEPRNG